MTREVIRRWVRRFWLPVAVAGLLAVYWLLPISGSVIVSTVPMPEEEPWPRIALSSGDPQPGDTVSISVTDYHPWSNVRLSIGGVPAELAGWHELPLMRNWTWLWTATVPDEPEAEIAFFVECHTGCQSRGVLTLRVNGAARTPSGSHEPTESRKPTKLCTVLPNPDRDWHGRSGYVVDMTYMALADDIVDPYWSVDALARRVATASAQGLRVLIRVEFDRGQTLPPQGDHIALSQYLAFVQRLANDVRLRTAEAFVIGAGPNSAGSNSLAPDRPVTPEWYARVLNGYGEPVEHSNNVVQVMHRTRPGARVVVGAIRPWSMDQNGGRINRIDAPWLNYMNTLVWALDQSATQKGKAGITDALVDGFALQAPGNLHAPEIDAENQANEPTLDLQKSEWNGAQSGFRVFFDWLEIINAYSATRGLPAYITATNTFTGLSDETPAQNYPPGWLSNALQVVNQEPQIRSLCWFMDFVPDDAQWDAFSLTKRPGQLVYAAEEFDELLRQERIE